MAASVPLPVEDPGVCLVFASHFEGITRALCNRAALLEKGQNIFFGDPEEALRCYRERAKTLAS